MCGSQSVRRIESFFSPLSFAELGKKRGNERTNGVNFKNGKLGHKYSRRSGRDTTDHEFSDQAIVSPRNIRDVTSTA